MPGGVDGGGGCAGGGRCGGTGGNDGEADTVVGTDADTTATPRAAVAAAGEPRREFIFAAIDAAPARSPDSETTTDSTFKEPAVTTSVICSGEISSAAAILRLNSRWSNDHSSDATTTFQDTVIELSGVGNARPQTTHRSANKNTLAH